MCLCVCIYIYIDSYTQVTERMTVQRMSATNERALLKEQADQALVLTLTCTCARARAHTHTHTHTHTHKRSAGRQTLQSDTSAVVAERGGTGELDLGDETWEAIVRVAGVPPVESLLVCIHTCIHACMYACIQNIDPNQRLGSH